MADWQLELPKLGTDQLDKPGCSSEDLVRTLIRPVDVQTEGQADTAASTCADVLCRS